MSSDVALRRAHAYLEDARDTTLNVSARVSALDACRSALLDARRARVSSSLLLPIFKELCSTASTHHAHPVRSVVPQAIDDWCTRELKTFVQTATPFLMAAIHDDHIIVIKHAMRTLTSLFRKLIGFVVSIGVSEDTFPEATLNTWMQMQAKAVSFITHADDGLRKSAIMFAETAVLAFSYSGSAGSSDHFTLDYILKKRSSCPLLDPNALEAEGVRCVNVVAHVLMAGLDGKLQSQILDGSHTFAIQPASFMTAIAVLSNLVRRRKKILQYTLPPLIKTVAMIIGKNGVPSKAFREISESQQRSIVAVLRYSLLATRAFQHARNGRPGNDISAAAADLTAYEKAQEIRRRERAAELASQQRIEKQAAEEARKAAAAKSAQMRSDLNRLSKAPNSDRPPSLMTHSPQEAFVIVQSLIHRMPHQEVVNFIMTRLLLNIPPPELVPGAARAAIKRTLSQSNEPVAKKPRKSRFGAKEPEKSNVASLPKKVVSIRKNAPPVVPVRLSDDATEKLVAICTRRILKRDEEAQLSGAGPLRVQLLARLLTNLARKESQVSWAFCDEACQYIANGVEQTIELALAWLHSLFFAHQYSSVKRARPNGKALQNIVSNAEKVNVDVNKAVSDDETTATKSPTATNADVAIKDSDSTARTSVKQEVKEQNMETTAPDSGGVKKEPVKVKQENGSVPHANEANETNETNETNEMTGVNNISTIAPDKQNGNEDSVENEHSETDPLDTSDSTNNADNAKDSNDTNKVNNTEDTEMKDKTDESDDLETDNEDENEELSPGQAYHRVLHKLLSLLGEKQDSNSNAFSALYTQAPLLTPSAIEELSKTCRDPSRMKMGLQTVSDIIRERTGDDRDTCLFILLKFAADKDDILRGPAIRLVANKIFVDRPAPRVAQKIEEYAISSLNGAIWKLSKTQTLENADLVDRSSALLTALCGQKHELLIALATCYASAPEEGKKVLLGRAKDLAGHIGMGSKSILNLIDGSLFDSEKSEEPKKFSAKDVEGLAMEVLTALLKKFGKPSEEIVKAACARYDLCGNIDFVIAVLSGLSRGTLIRYLSAIVNAKATIENDDKDTHAEPNDKNSHTSGIKDIITSIMMAQPAPLSPAELLLELHKIEPSSAVSVAIRGCFELKAIYKQNAVAQALQQLLEMSEIPALLMRTVHLARIFLPELESYLTQSVMERLIDKKIWRNESVWEGYLRYCAEVKEKSVKLLLSLPTQQLEEALNRQPVLTAVFKELVSNKKNAKRIQPKHRKAIASAIKKASSRR